MWSSSFTGFSRAAPVPTSLLAPYLHGDDLEDVKPPASTGALDLLRSFEALRRKRWDHEHSPATDQTDDVRADNDRSPWPPAPFSPSPMPMLGSPQSAQRLQEQQHHSPAAASPATSGVHVQGASGHKALAAGTAAASAAAAASAPVPTTPASAGKYSLRGRYKPDQLPSAVAALPNTTEGQVQHDTQPRSGTRQQAEGAGLEGHAASPVQLRQAWLDQVAASGTGPIKRKPREVYVDAATQRRAAAGQGAPLNVQNAIGLPTAPFGAPDQAARAGARPAALKQGSSRRPGDARPGAAAVPSSGPGARPGGAMDAGRPGSTAAVKAKLRGGGAVTASAGGGPGQAVGRVALASADAQLGSAQARQGAAGRVAAAEAPQVKGAKAGAPGAGLAGGKTAAGKRSSAAAVAEQVVDAAGSGLQVQGVPLAPTSVQPAAKVHMRGTPAASLPRYDSQPSVGFRSPPPSRQQGRDAAVAGASAGANVGGGGPGTPGAHTMSPWALGSEERQQQRLQRLRELRTRRGATAASSEGSEVVRLLQGMDAGTGPISGAVAPQRPDWHGAASINTSSHVTSTIGATSVTHTSTSPLPHMGAQPLSPASRVLSTASVTSPPHPGYSVGQAFSSPQQVFYHKPMSPQQSPAGSPLPMHMPAATQQAEERPAPGRRRQLWGQGQGQEAAEGFASAPMQRTSVPKVSIAVQTDAPPPAQGRGQGLSQAADVGGHGKKGAGVKSAQASVATSPPRPTYLHPSIVKVTSAAAGATAEQGSGRDSSGVAAAEAGAEISGSGSGAEAGAVVGDTLASVAAEAGSGALGKKPMVSEMIRRFREAPPMPREQRAGGGGATGAGAGATGVSGESGDGVPGLQAGADPDKDPGADRAAGTHDDTGKVGPEQRHTDASTSTSSDGEADGSRRGQQGMQHASTQEEVEEGDEDEDEDGEEYGEGEELFVLRGTSVQRQRAFEELRGQLAAAGRMASGEDGARHGRGADAGPKRSARAGSSAREGSGSERYSEAVDGLAAALIQRSRSLLHERETIQQRIHAALQRVRPAAGAAGPSGARGSRQEAGALAMKGGASGVGAPAGAGAGGAMSPSSSSSSSLDVRPGSFAAWMGSARPAGGLTSGAGGAAGSTGQAGVAAAASPGRAAAAAAGKQGQSWREQLKALLREVHGDAPASALSPAPAASSPPPAASSPTLGASSQALRGSPRGALQASAHTTSPIRAVPSPGSSQAAGAQGPTSNGQGQQGKPSDAGVVGKGLNTGLGLNGAAAPPAMDSLRQELKRSLAAWTAAMGAATGPAADGGAVSGDGSGERAGGVGSTQAQVASSRDGASGSAAAGREGSGQDLLVPQDEPPARGLAVPDLETVLSQLAARFGLRVQPVAEQGDVGLGQPAAAVDALVVPVSAQLQLQATAEGASQDVASVELSSVADLAPGQQQQGGRRRWAVPEEGTSLAAPLALQQTASSPVTPAVPLGVAAAGAGVADAGQPVAGTSSASDVRMGTAGKTSLAGEGASSPEPLQPASGARESPEAVSLSPSASGLPEPVFQPTWSPPSPSQSLDSPTGGANVGGGAGAGLSRLSRSSGADLRASAQQQEQQHGPAGEAISSAVGSTEHGDAASVPVDGHADRPHNVEQGEASVVRPPSRHGGPASVQVPAQGAGAAEGQGPSAQAALAVGPDTALQGLREPGARAQATPVGSRQSMPRGAAVDSLSPGGMLGTLLDVAVSDMLFAATPAPGAARGADGAPSPPARHLSEQLGNSRGAQSGSSGVLAAAAALQSARAVSQEKGGAATSPQPILPRAGLDVQVSLAVAAAAGQGSSPCQGSPDFSAPPAPVAREAPAEALAGLERGPGSPSANAEMSRFMRALEGRLGEGSAPHWLAVEGFPEGDLLLGPLESPTQSIESDRTFLSGRRIGGLLDNTVSRYLFGDDDSLASGSVRASRDNLFVHSAGQPSGGTRGSRDSLRAMLLGAGVLGMTGNAGGSGASSTRASRDGALRASTEGGAAWTRGGPEAEAGGASGSSSGAGWGAGAAAAGLWMRQQRAVSAPGSRRGTAEDVAGAGDDVLVSEADPGLGFYPGTFSAPSSQRQTREDWTDAATDEGRPDAMAQTLAPHHPAAAAAPSVSASIEGLPSAGVDPSASGPALASAHAASSPASAPEQLVGARTTAAVRPKYRPQPVADADAVLMAEALDPPLLGTGGKPYALQQVHAEALVAEDESATAAVLPVTFGFGLARPTAAATDIPLRRFGEGSSRAAADSVVAQLSGVGSGDEPPRSPSPPLQHGGRRSVVLLTPHAAEQQPVSQPQQRQQQHQWQQQQQPEPDQVPVPASVQQPPLQPGPAEYSFTHGLVELEAEGVGLQGLREGAEGQGEGPKQHLSAVERPEPLTQPQSVVSTTTSDSYAASEATSEGPAYRPGEAPLQFVLVQDLLGAAVAVVAAAAGTGVEGAAGEQAGVGPWADTPPGATGHVDPQAEAAAEAGGSVMHDPLFGGDALWPLGRPWVPPAAPSCTVTVLESSDDDRLAEERTSQGVQEGAKAAQQLEQEGAGGVKTGLQQGGDATTGEGADADGAGKRELYQPSQGVAITAAGFETGAAASGAARAGTGQGHDAPRATEKGSQPPAMPQRWQAGALQGGEERSSSSSSSSMQGLAGLGAAPAPSGRPALEEQRRRGDMPAEQPNKAPVGFGATRGAIESTVGQALTSINAQDATITAGLGFVPPIAAVLESAADSHTQGAGAHAVGSAAMAAALPSAQHASWSGSASSFDSYSAASDDGGGGAEAVHIVNTEDARGNSHVASHGVAGALEGSGAAPASSSRAAGIAPPPAQLPLPTPDAGKSAQRPSDGSVWAAAAGHQVQQQQLYTGGGHIAGQEQTRGRQSDDDLVYPGSDGQTWDEPGFAGQSWSPFYPAEELTGQFGRHGDGSLRGEEDEGGILDMPRLQSAERLVVVISDCERTVDTQNSRAAEQQREGAELAEQQQQAKREQQPQLQAEGGQQRQPTTHRQVQHHQQVDMPGAQHQHDLSQPAGPLDAAAVPTQPALQQSKLLPHALGPGQASALIQPYDPPVAPQQALHPALLQVPAGAVALVLTREGVTTPMALASAPAPISPASQLPVPPLASAEPQSAPAPANAWQLNLSPAQVLPLQVSPQPGLVAVVAAQPHLPSPAVTYAALGATSWTPAAASSPALSYGMTTSTAVTDALLLPPHALGVAAASSATASHTTSLLSGQYQDGTAATTPFPLPALQPLLAGDAAAATVPMAALPPLHVMPPQSPVSALAQLPLNTHDSFGPAATSSADDAVVRLLQQKIQSCVQQLRILGDRLG